MAADIIIPYLIGINPYLSIEITAIGFGVQEFCLGGRVAVVLTYRHTVWYV